MTYDRAKSLGLAAVLGVVALGFSSSWTNRARAARPQAPPPDSSWMADAAVENPRIVTDAKLGACQGIAVRDGRIYAYGDVYSVKPRVGVIREYDMDLNPTGREVWLRQADRPLIIHPDMVGPVKYLLHPPERFSLVACGLDAIRLPGRTHAPLSRRSFSLFSPLLFGSVSLLHPGGWTNTPRHDRYDGGSI
jgi:hypothetical protein